MEARITRSYLDRCRAAGYGVICAHSVKERVDVPNDHRSPGHKDGEGEKESANRHVYIEPRVKIDIVDDLRKQRHAERSEDKTAQSKQLRWTKITAVLVAVYTLVMIVQTSLTRQSLKTTREFFEKDQRPWMAFDKQQGEAMSIKGKVAQLGANTGTVTLLYRLVNVGHLPAQVRIEGEVLEIFPEERATYDRSREAQHECSIGADKFAAEHPLTIVPGTPTFYGIIYDGKPSDDTAQHGPFIKFRKASQKHFLINVGCIIYQQGVEVGDNARPHYTPFVAYLAVNDPGGNPLDGPFIVGNAN
jgi:hypothetical protein